MGFVSSFTNPIQKIYIIGSLRNPKIPEIGNRLRAEGLNAFDDWFAGSEIADDAWRDYEKLRGRGYKSAIFGEAARHIFEFDRHHLNYSDAGVLVMPAGKSGHLEAGYLAGQGKPVFVLFDEEPERWDVMYQFCDDIFFDLEGVVARIHKFNRERSA